MNIKDTIEKVPGGLMVVPLMLGATLNTIDQLQIPFIVEFLKILGVSAQESGNYEFLRIGGFSQQLFKDGALVLIALFLFCCGSQMNLKVGGKALKVGSLLLVSKYLSGIAVGFLLAFMFDPFDGFLGLSLIAIVAAMTNGNGGMYAALTSQYGRRSDVGGVAVLSLNDGPFLTMVALGVIGQSFPFIAFIAVLLPIGIGMLLGNLDPKMREFLKHGESLPVPFFAFALGAGMNLTLFFNPQIVGAGVFLGVATTVVTGFAGMLAFKLFKERSVIAPWAEASTAGNATATPIAIATAAGSSAALSAAEVARYEALVPIATAQVSLAVIVTAILCPIAVIMVDKWQRKRGIDGRLEDDELPTVEETTTK